MPKMVIKQPCVGCNRTIVIEQLTTLPNGSEICTDCIVSAVRQLGTRVRRWERRSAKLIK
jgi:hypothetical protein